MDAVEASRNNMGRHSACPRTPVPHPHYKRPMAPDAGEVTLLDVSDSPVAG